MQFVGVTWGDRKGRGRMRLLGVALAIAAIGPSSATQQPAQQSARYIVQAVPGALAAAEDAVRRAGGTVVAQLGLINGFTALLTDDGASAVRHDESVVATTPDAVVSLQGAAYAPVWDAGSPQALAQAVGADMYWQNGFYGQGIGVAVLDSGVVKVDGLQNNVFYGPDLTPEGVDVNLRNLDTFGHGTFMAGLIAGRSNGLARPYLADWRDTTYLGVAPEARIISVKAADSIGTSYTSTIVQGIDWVVQHRRDAGLNIRVLNLSLGMPNTSGYQNDPVSAAAERAWAAGIVVVAAAGNDGTSGVLLPAADPYVIAVGALENKSTVSISDDTVAAFSNRGNATRTPDFVASGTHLVGLRVPGSHIDVSYGSTGIVSPRFFRGSGTSESAAVASGAVALLLSQYPSATPDQVKAALKKSARMLAGFTSTTAGTGGLYVAGSFGQPLPAAPQNFTHATNWTTPSANWSGGTWSGGVWTGPGAPPPTASLSSARWTGSSWSSARWTGSTWSGSAWASSRWTGTRWTGSGWATAGWS